MRLDALITGCYPVYNERSGAVLDWLEVTVRFLAFILALWGFAVSHEPAQWYGRQMDSVVTGPHGWEGPPPGRN